MQRDSAKVEAEALHLLSSPWPPHSQVHIVKNSALEGAVKGFRLPSLFPALTSVQHAVMTYCVLDPALSSGH